MNLPQLETENNNDGNNLPWMEKYRPKRFEEMAFVNDNLKTCKMIFLMI